MQSINWTEKHSEALRKFLADGMSYSRLAEAINAKFNTAYSRSAAIGRAKRMGLSSPDRPMNLPPHWPMLPSKSSEARSHRLRERRTSGSMRPMPVYEVTEAAKLRCVEIEPRQLSLLDLERGDCRYPYGGDENGEAITFCGHPRRPGSSYCVAHFHLTRGPGTASERAAGTVLLRLVQAA